MTMSAKFPGTCHKCGQKISIGDKIEWESGKGATHIECPEATAAGAVPAANTIRISKGEGYGGHEYQVGQVLRNPREKSQILYVLKASKKYYSDDGMSFGVGDERGYVFIAEGRIATDEEAAPLLEREAAAAAKKVAEARRKEIAKQIQQTGERPEGDNVPEGDRFSDRQSIYGSGDWFIIGTEHIWYCQNNGMDGDNWSCNNVRTGGAGAIGWRMPFDAGLAEEIKKFV